MMDGLMEPSMPALPPSVIREMKETDVPPAAQAAQYTGVGDEVRKDSFDEEDQAMLGLTGEKKRFSFSAGAGGRSSARKSVTTAEDKRTSAVLGPRVNLSAKQKNDLALAFEAFDVTGTGYMSTEDLRVALRALGFDARKNEMKKILEIFDKGNTGRLCYADFMTIIEMKLGEDDSKDDLLKAFKLFDKDQTGHISFNNLRQVATELGEEVNDEEIAEMLAEADLDDDGTLDLEEFLKIMKKAALY